MCWEALGVTVAFGLWISTQECPFPATRTILTMVADLDVRTTRVLGEIAGR